MQGSKLILPSFFIFLLLIESFFPLRKVVIPRWTRIFRNVSLAFVGFLIIKLIFLPHLISFSTFVSLNKIGVLNLFEISFWPKFIISLVLMDFTLYFWHMANHKIPFFWRFHLVHHTDLEMDASTASRFHFGELVLSVFFRAMQILVFGIDPLMLLIFETSITFCALFHHSNIKLPISFERILSKIVVTPRMHAIHHSQVLEETDSNFSTIFSFWDRFLRTLSLNVPQDKITIGVPAYNKVHELTFLNVLVMPVFKLRPWSLPGGKIPKRENLETPKEFLCG